MHPISGTVNTATASTISTQPQAEANSDSEIKIKSVKSSPDQMDMGSVGLSFVYEVLYSSNAFVLPHIRCLPIVIPDGDGGEVVENCTVDQSGHSHTAQVFREVSVDDNPIPLGASWRQDTLRYINEDELGFSIPEDSVVAETTIESFFENDDSENQIGGRLETIRNLVAVPIGLGQSPTLILGFRRHISYAPQSVDTESIESLPDTFMPRYEALFKIQEILSGQERYPEWNVPHHWDKLPSAIQEIYLKDIIELYDAGTTLHVIGRRHGIHVKAVRALIYLQVGNRLRTTRDELLKSIANRDNNGFPQGMIVEYISPLKEQLRLVRAMQLANRPVFTESD